MLGSIWPTLLPCVMPSFPSLILSTAAGQDSIAALLDNDCILCATSVGLRPRIVKQVHSISLPTLLTETPEAPTLYPAIVVM